MHQLNIAGALYDVAPLEHAFLSRHNDFRWQHADFVKRPRVVHETWHVGGCEAIDHAGHADRFASEDAGIDCGFGVVADDTSDELHAGRNLFVAVLHIHQAVRVF